MGQHALSRTELLIGKAALENLRRRKVVVFGIGGVGSYTVEALARAGIGQIVLVDDDTVCLTNINRQLHATFKTLGRPKVEVMKERILDINPECTVTAHQVFVTADNIPSLIPDDTDYVVDAIDTVASKIALAVYCQEKELKLICCLGTGNKLDPTQFRIADIYDTKICPLARAVRGELKKRGVKSLKVLYSEELPIQPRTEETVTCKGGCVCTGGSTKKCLMKKQIPGSNSFVPPVAGLIIGGEVIKTLMADSAQ